jgi:type I restriction enzyme S subunit
VNVTALPKDWSLLPLGDLAYVYAGGTPSRAVASYWGGEIPWVTTAEVDAVYITSSRERITTEALRFSAAKIAQPGTLLLAMYGQGKTRGKVAMLRIPSAMNQACAAIEVGTRVDAGYLLYYLSAQYDAIRGMSNSGSQDNLSGHIVKGIPVAFPPIPEQRAIAATLDDVTGLTKELEGLIAKKRGLKQGMMQELLTGKTRLPGFAGEWRIRKIGDFAEVRAGGTPSTAILRYWGEDIRWMNSGEIRKKRVWEVAGRITQDGLRESSAQLLPVGTVLMALAGQGKTRGTVAVSRVELTTNQSIAGIFPSREHDSDFLYYNLDTRYDELRGESAGDGGRGGLNLTIIKKLDVLMPPPDEQAAIASVLTDVDDELAALERCLKSARGVKTGMMQELLTGRTRLPVEAAS